MLRVETELFIDAPPEKIWAILMDFDNWGDWNPFVYEISGKHEKGAKLKIKVNSPDGSGMKLTLFPKINVFEDGKMLAWRGNLYVPGLFDGCHYFRLDKAGNGTLLTHGESFSGVLTGLLRKKVLGKYPKGYEALNIALAKRADELK